MKLKERIKEKGFRINFVAKQIGISEVLMSYYLNGTRPMPEHIKENIERFLRSR